MQGPAVPAPPHSPARKLDSLSAEEVCTLVFYLDLGKYEARFRNYPVNGAMLAKAKDAQLRELGVEAEMHREELLRRIEEFVATGVPQEKFVSGP